MDLMVWIDPLEETVNADDSVIDDAVTTREMIDDVEIFIISFLGNMCFSKKFVCLMRKCCFLEFISLWWVEK